MEPPAAATPDAAPAPGRPRRGGAWVLALILLAGATVGANRLSAAPEGTTNVDRFDPLEVGSTWYYRTSTNGGEPATAASQVVGTSLIITAGTTRRVAVIESRFEDFAGFGPYRQLLYEARNAARSLYQQRINRQDAQRIDPPQPWLGGNLRAGASWTWSGTIGTQKQGMTAHVTGPESVTAGGRTFEGCLHVHREYTFPDDPGSAENADEWRCPGVGVVRARNEVPSRSLVFDQELVAVRAPGRSLGTVPVSPAGAAAADQGRTRTVAGTLGPPVAAWLDARAGYADAPPGGGDGLLLVGDEDGTLSASETATGLVRWRLSLPPPIVAMPVLAGGRVFAADGAKDLFALDATTGSTLWVARLADVVSATPVVVGDVVVAAEDDRSVRAFGVADGRPRWTAATDDLVKQPLAVSGGDVISGDLSGGVQALRANDGRVRWSAALDGPLDGGPSVSGDAVVTVDDSAAVSVLDAGTGAVRWTRGLGAYALPSGAPAIGGGLAVVAHESTTGESAVRAFSLADGREAWRSNVRSGFSSAPLIVGDTVAVTSDDARLFTLSLESGGTPTATPLPRVDPRLPADVRFGLTVVGDQVVTAVQTRSPWFHTLYAGLDLTGPAPGVALEAEARPLGATWRVPPVLVGQDLVLAPFDGGVLRAPPSGRPRTVRTLGPAGFLRADGDSVFVQDGADALGLDARTGAVRWRTPVGASGPGSGAAVADGRLFVTVPDVGLVALDAATGRALWTRPTTGVGLGGPLALPGGDVVSGVGAIQRLDGRTGRVRWELPGASSFGPMVADDSNLYAILELASTNALVALGIGDGAVRWVAPISPGLLSGPGAGSGVVVAVDGHGLAQAYDASTQAPRWSLQLRTPACGSAVIRGGVAYLMEGGRTEDLSERDFRIVAVDAATGRFLASFEPLGSSAYAGDCSVLDDGRVAVDGALVAQLIRMGPS